MNDQRNRSRLLPRIGATVNHTVLIATSALMLLPFSWMLATSLRLPKDSFNLPPALLPTSFHTANYTAVFRDVPFFSFILNSVAVTAVATILQCIISAAAAYPFARMKFRGRNALFLLMLSGLMIPVQVTVIPLFLMFRQVDLIDTRTALVLPALVFPMGIFILRQHMLTLPTSYEEAARLDGAGHLRIFWNVILPMSRPALVVVAMLSGLATWNDFFRPLIFINSIDKMTIPLGLTVLDGFARTSNIAVVLAGVVISIVPPLVLFILGSRHLVRGMALTGLKG
ncbi:carbohydrate ABC transporter permease [Polymorphospora sp. NPDC050346]|uniref:carbohydrate ABC transporter permease n=1 Tax=Polymorphospora sp. NPDC050346 TaxID=3155780 RepID=UPI0033DE80CE